MAKKRSWYHDIKGSRHLAGVRDSSRSKCYQWEFKNLRGKPEDGTFADKGAAKGFARLCRNVALRRLEERLIAKGWSTERAAAFVSQKREVYRAHLTKENARFSCGGTNGVFFASWGWTKVIIAHELAHFADIAEAEALNVKRAGHGPDWLGWFFFLLVDCVGFDLNYLRGTALVAGCPTPFAK